MSRYLSRCAPEQTSIPISRTSHLLLPCLHLSIVAMVMTCKAWVLKLLLPGFSSSQKTSREPNFSVQLPSRSVANLISSKVEASANHFLSDIKFPKILLFLVNIVSSPLFNEVQRRVDMGFIDAICGLPSAKEANPIMRATLDVRDRGTGSGGLGCGSTPSDRGREASQSYQELGVPLIQVDLERDPH